MTTPLEKKNSEIWVKHKTEINKNIKTTKRKINTDLKILLFFYSIIIFFTITSLVLRFFIIFQLWIIITGCILYFITWFVSDNFTSKQDLEIGTLEEILNVDNELANKAIYLSAYFLGYSYFFSFYIGQNKKEAVFTRNTFIIFIAFLTCLRLHAITIV